MTTPTAESGHAGGRRGAVLAALLADLVALGERCLVVGPHPEDAVGVLRARMGDLVTAPVVPTETEHREAYDVVLAAGGLDAVRPIADEQNWRQRLDRLESLVRPAGLLIVGLVNPASLPRVASGWASRRPDEGWQHEPVDPSRPATADELVGVLARPGWNEPFGYAAFGGLADPAGLITNDSLVRTAAGYPAAMAAQLARVATAAAADDADPLLAVALADAGLLGSLADGWLAVRGATGRQGYLAGTAGAGGAAGEVIRLDRGADRTLWRLDAGQQRRADVPNAPSVDSLLLRMAAAPDEPAFKRLAAALGEWFTGSGERHSVVRFDELVCQQRGRGQRRPVIAAGVAGAEWPAGADGQLRLAQAWYRFADRLLASGVEHPWPASFGADQLVRLWLTMSRAGDVGSADLAKARTLTPSPVRPARDQLAAVTHALADAETMVAGLRERVELLESAIQIRDRQLRVREHRIRRLRSQVTDQMLTIDRLADALTALRGSRSHQLSFGLQRLVEQAQRLGRGS